jgi:hypothetical protein
MLQTAHVRLALRNAAGTARRADVQRDCTRERTQRLRQQRGSLASMVGDATSGLPNATLVRACCCSARRRHSVEADAWCVGGGRCSQGPRGEYLPLVGDCFSLPWSKRRYGAFGLEEDKYVMELCPFQRAVQYALEAWQKREDEVPTELACALCDAAAPVPCDVP